MKEHSKVRDRRTAPAGTDGPLMAVRDFLISDDFAWEGVPESKSASFCGVVPLRGIDMRAGVYVAFTVRCDTYNHRSCAEAKMLRKLLLMQGRVAPSGMCHFAVIKTSEFSGSLLTGRRDRLAEKLNRPVWYVWVRRTNGLTYIFASDPLTGRKEPLTFFKTDNPLPIIANAMMLPGVLRIQSSRAGIPDDDHDDHGTHDLEILGYALDPTFERVERIAAAIALERYGIDVNPLAPMGLDGGVAPERWLECMQTAWGRARGSTNAG